MNPKDLIKRLSSVAVAATALIVGGSNSEVHAIADDKPVFKIPKSGPTVVVQKLILHAARARQNLFARHSSHSSHASHASHASHYSGSNSYVPADPRPQYTAPAYTPPAEPRAPAPEKVEARPKSGGATIDKASLPAKKKFVKPLTKAVVKKLQAIRSKWPQEVVLMNVVSFPLRQNGVVVGVAELEPGAKIHVVNVIGSKVVGSYQGSEALVPIDQTDFIKQLGGESSILEMKAQ